MEERLVSSNAGQFADSALIGGLIFSFVITLVLWFLVSILRVEFVKWIIAAVAAYGAVALIGALTDEGAASPVIGGLIVMVMNLIAAGLLFTPAARAWFRAGRGTPGGS